MRGILAAIVIGTSLGFLLFSIATAIETEGPGVLVMRTIHIEVK